MRLLRCFGVALAALGAFLPIPTGRADDANAECTNNNDITIVVDFNELGGGVNVRCAPQPVNSGFDAFKRAGIAVDDYRGFVCRIAGAPDDAPCNRYPPGNYYWVYWLASRGGSWCYSQAGAGNRTPPPGTIEGWSFFKKSSSKPQSTPPRYPVPAALAGTTPHQLDAGDCASSTSPPPAEPTGPNPGDGGGSAEPAPPGAAPRSTSPGASPATGARPRDEAATTTSGASVATTTTALELGLPSAASTTTSAVPFGDVDLTIRRHDSKSSPVGLLVGAGVIATLASVGYVIRRRA